ncbi:MAG: hypothetical protein mread185_000270 [Mycoplasmataceae bacterium]|nr:MAG: hypothetical protein mread185_000270 [Mycoplasmataceae bacterium]
MNSTILKAPTIDERLAKVEKDIEKLNQRWEDYRNYRIEEAQKVLDELDKSKKVK